MINVKNIKIKKILKINKTNVILLGLYNKQYLLITLFNNFSYNLNDYKNLFNKSKLHLNNKSNYFYTNKFDTNGSINVIYPISLKQIKNIGKDYYVKYNESYKTYIKLLKKYPNFFKNNWVENVLLSSSNSKYYKHLDKNIIKNIKSEQKRLIYCNKKYVPNTINKNNFLIAKNDKWKDKKVDNLMLIVWTMDKSIKCLRCLNKKHLPILKNIKKTLLLLCKKKYKLLEDDINIFFHYLPSVYQLHIHVHNKKINIGFYPGKAHLLDQVISNIENISNYYQKFDILVSISKYSKYLELVKTV